MKWRGKTVRTVGSVAAVVAVVFTLLVTLSEFGGKTIHGSGTGSGVVGTPSPVWAGYEAPNPHVGASAPLQAQVTLPQVTCDTVGVVSMRLGYNGLGAVNSSTVAQVGVMAKCARIGGSASYLLFYELDNNPNRHDPAHPVYVDGDLAIRLQPGDTVDLSVTLGPPLRNGGVIFSLLAHDSSGRNLGSWGTFVAGAPPVYPVYDTAECVVEDTPTLDLQGKTTGLPQFSGLFFNNCSVFNVPNGQFLTLVQGCIPMAKVRDVFGTATTEGFDVYHFYSGIPKPSAHPQATVCMPFTGRWAHNILTTAGCGPSNSQTSDPSCHPIYYGDWSTDVFAPAGTPVNLNVSSGDGQVSFYWIPSSNGSCGQRTVIGVKVNGITVGSIYFEHLSGAIKSGPITNGMTVGYVHSWGCNPGPHVHIELKDSHQAPFVGVYSCFIDYRHQLPEYYPYTAGMPLTKNYALGMLGASYASGQRQACFGMP